ncbi:MAG: serine/threonine protein kinase [Cyanobacteria bacterium]|nr:serine/threonine protein kinase [Cyanobacteriota bacterium]
MSSDHNLPTCQQCQMPVVSCGCAEDLPPSKTVQKGDVFAVKYRILDLLGEGSMGCVFLAEHLILEKKVAIKILRRQAAADEKMVEGLKEEARRFANLNHPHLVSVFDFGITAQRFPYVVMEFVDGTDLKTVLKTEGALKPIRALKLALQICDALGFAHDQGVLHRDLKPNNIILFYMAGGEHVKLVDFGIAKSMRTRGEMESLNETGELMGSPAYMSPEEIMGVNVDRRSDIYSLGCVLYEMLTGRQVFRGASLMDTLTLQVEQAPRSLMETQPALKEVPGLESVMRRSLEKHPEARFQSLDQLRDQLTISLEQLEKSKKGRSQRDANRGLLSLVAVVLALVLIGFVYLALAQPTSRIFLSSLSGSNFARKTPTAEIDKYTCDSRLVRNMALELGLGNFLEREGFADNAIEHYQQALSDSSVETMPVDARLTVSSLLMRLYEQRNRRIPAEKLVADVRALIRSQDEKDSQLLAACVVYRYACLLAKDAQSLYASDSESRGKQLHQATELLEEALGTFEKFQAQTPFLAVCYLQLGEVAKLASDNKKAALYFDKYLSLKGGPFDQRVALRVRAMKGLAEVKNADGDSEGALSLLNQALEICKKNKSDETDNLANEILREKQEFIQVRTSP